MDPDLFSPQDTAALLAVREAARQRPLSRDDLLAAFFAAGLMEGPAEAPPLAAAA